MKKQKKKLRGYRRINPAKHCFICGLYIHSRRSNAIYCKKCHKAKFDIRNDINNLVYSANLKDKYPDYCFYAHIKIVKKREL